MLKGLLKGEYGLLLNSIRDMVVNISQSVFSQGRAGVRGKEALCIVGIRGIRCTKASLHL